MRYQKSLVNAYNTLGWPIGRCWQQPAASLCSYDWQVLAADGCCLVFLQGSMGSGQMCTRMLTLFSVSRCAQEFSHYVLQSIHVHKYVHTSHNYKHTTCTKVCTIPMHKCAQNTSAHQCLNIWGLVVVNLYLVSVAWKHVSEVSTFWP